MSAVRAEGVALIGTGVIGAPMALRLLRAGLLKTIWNRSANRAEALIKEGAVLAETPAAAVANASIACLCLTDGAAIEDVVFGMNGIVADERAAPRLIIDFTTSTPDSTRRLAALYSERTGGAWLDAPITGGAARAENGELVIFCGGTQASFDTAQPVLRALSKRADLVGPIGAGQTIKLCAQLIGAPQIVSIAEALAAAEANGVDPAKLPDLLAGGMTDSPLLQVFGRRMVEAHKGPRIGAIATMLKDISAAVDMAQSAGAATPLAVTARDLYRAIDATGDHELEYLYTYIQSELARRPKL